MIVTELDEWEIKTFGPKAFEVVAGGRQIGLFRIPYNYDRAPTPEELAKAHGYAVLFAAAPALLDCAIAAMEILNVLIEEREGILGEEDEVARDLHDRFRDAITKAEGQS